MYCQICGAWNPEEGEYCTRCHHKLLVISGADYTLEDEEAFDGHPEEQYSFDEHLLERISILEEVVRRLTGTVRQTLSTLHKLEQNILVNQTGVTTLRDILESKKILGREEWGELWETRMDYQLLALEKRERFAAVKGQIAALYRGGERGEFLGRLEKAEHALLAFDIGGALGELEAAHGLDPANHELSFFLGETLFNEGEKESALHYFFSALASRHDHFGSLLYGGVLCHEQGQEARAEELLKRAVAVRPDAFLPAFSLGAVYASRGRLAPAALYLERAVRAEPVPQAVYLLGSCCFEMGKVGAAIGHLEEAVRLDPSSQETHHLLGLAYLDRRWYRKAQEAFRDAQRLRPARLDHHELVGFLAGIGATPVRGTAARGTADRGTAVRGAAAEMTAKAFEWLQRGEDAFGDGEAKEALSCYRRAVAHDPENPALLVAYAMACLELGRTGEIEALVDKALRLEPGERLRASAYATLIEALRLEGKYRESNRVGRLLLAEDRSDFAQSVACFEMAFNLAEMEEDLDRALSLARRSVELAPEELQHLPLAALGWVHYKRREFPESVDVLTRSSDLAASARTLTHLGMALLASGERDRARRVLDRARTAGGPKNALTGNLLEVFQGGASMLQDPH
jgi:tetratricopeptide (TPR) repeat protein